MSFLSNIGHSYATLAPRAAEALWGREEREEQVEIETARRLAKVERAQSLGRQFIQALGECEFIPGGYDAEDIGAVLVDLLGANPVIMADHIEAAVREDLP